MLPFNGSTTHLWVKVLIVSLVSFFIQTCHFPLSIQAPDMLMLRFADLFFLEWLGRKSWMFLVYRPSNLNVFAKCTVYLSLASCTHLKTCQSVLYSICSLYLFFIYMYITWFSFYRLRDVSLLTILSAKSKSIT